ncbi:retrovirus-related Pol polyprotein from type-1 retrotransposable element R2 [Trichonephila clavipes]|nr:retrovirus-related Pol polyprotein from type-1 retrotransposable element R2 [Trichonephila clavipes]
MQYLRGVLNLRPYELGTNPPILLRSGVKQGCPLSGILFNLSIDKVLRTVQENWEQRSILAFAYDIVLMADSANDLQDMMSATAQELRALCLRLNPRKCASLHLSGRAPTGARPTKFFIEDSEVQALEDGKHYPIWAAKWGFFLTELC